MSQFFVNSSGSSPPPVVVETLTGDTGIATSSANNINVPGGTSSANNTNGVTTTGSGSTLTVSLTNRIPGSVSTTTTGTSNILSFTPPLLPGIYKLFIEVAGWDNADATGSTYELSGAVKADGAGGLLTVGSPTRFMNGDDTVFNISQVDVSVGGGVINVTATGLSGKTIKWTGLLTYVFGGA